MALGTNYARTGRKRDLLVMLGMHRIGKHGWTRKEAEAEMRSLRNKKVAEVAMYFKNVKVGK